MPRYRPSSTSDMLAGLTYKGKEIKKVDKVSDTQRKITFTDNTSITVPKQEIAALARIRGGMQSVEALSKLTPRERKERLGRTLQRAETSIGKDRKKFIAQREYVGSIAKDVEGVPSIKFVRKRGVRVPVLESYYSRKVDVKTVVARVQSEMGDKWVRKFKNFLRQAGVSVSQALQKLKEEFQSKEGK